MIRRLRMRMLHLYLVSNFKYCLHRIACRIAYVTPARMNLRFENPVFER